MFDEKKKQELAQPQQPSTTEPPKAGTMPISTPPQNRTRPVPTNPQFSNQASQRMDQLVQQGSQPNNPPTQPTLTDMSNQLQSAPQQTIGTQETGGRFSAVRNALNSRTQEIQKTLKPQIQQPAAPAPQPIQQSYSQLMQQAQQPSGMGGDKSLPPPTIPQQPVNDPARMDALRSLGLAPQTPSIVSREEFDRRMSFRRPESPGGLQTADFKPEEAFQSQFRGISYDEYVNAGGQLSPEMKAQQRQRMIDAAKKSNRIEAKPAVEPRIQTGGPAPVRPVQKPAPKPAKKPVKNKILKYKNKKK